MDNLPPLAGELAETDALAQTGALPRPSPPPRVGGRFAKRQPNPNGATAEAPPASSASSTDSAPPVPPKKRRRRSTGRPTGRPPRETTLAGVQDQLAAQLLFLGGALAMVRPITGAVLMDRSERAASDVMQIAARNPRVLAIVKALVQWSVYADAAELGFELLIANGLDAGRVPPDHPITTPIRAFIPDDAAEQWRQRQAEAQQQREAAERADTGAVFSNPIAPLAS
jgi:hypothetical protein